MTPHSAYLYFPLNAKYRALHEALLTLLLYTLLCFSPSFMAHANPPLPPTKQAPQHVTLDTLEETLKTQEKEKARLEKQRSKIKGGVSKVKKQLVKIGKSIQDNESTLQNLEGRIESLESEKSQIENKLDSDRRSIARLILALERIRRVPPQALIAKPGAPLKTAQSAMLMQEIIPTLNEQAKTLRINLSRLDDIADDLNIKKAQALKTADTLKKEHGKLSTLVARREALYASTNKNLEAQKKEIKKISAKAQNLQDLVETLSKQKPARKPQQKVAVTAKPLPKSGTARMPISGFVRVGYNQTDAFGSPNKGISIEGIGGALVVAPMGGTVRFTGAFKNYGNMVIIEHSGGYHSLVAGFEKIDTVVGQNVSAGEPLGLLHYATPDQTKPALYYELRKDGKPVNPALKLGRLG